jgi:hypothetical protein
MANINKTWKYQGYVFTKNTTALIQPLDQGIIYSFKVNYIGLLLIVQKYQMLRVS